MSEQTTVLADSEVEQEVWHKSVFRIVPTMCEVLDCAKCIGECKIF
jgi:hypothetical protein